MREMKEVRVERVVVRVLERRKVRPARMMSLIIHMP